MADSGGAEKTEEATAKKKQDARKEGNVLKSQEVNTAFSAIVMFGFLTLAWKSGFNSLIEMMKTLLSPEALYPASEMSRAYLSKVMARAVMEWVGVVWPIMLVAMVSGFAINILQVGFLYTTKPLKPKLSKISPLKGFKRMFSIRSLTELLKSTLKVIILGFILYRDYEELLMLFPSLIGLDLYSAFTEVIQMAIEIALKMAAAMVVIGAADYLFQRWKYKKDLKMTKQEVKDEYKNTEGDPQIKSKIRQKQREMSALRMMDAVPQADVVITNPTHYAVALKYDEKTSRAPMCVAKGQDFLARKIKEIARDHDIMIVEDPPLARSLYALVEVGDEIPADLYQAVADILVYVYKQKKVI